jgi:hypothetical protein
LYHFDPSNPPTKAGRYANSGTSRKKLDRQKSLNSSGKPNYRENANNNTNNNGNYESEKNVALNNKQQQPVSHTKLNVASSTNDDQTDLPPLEVPQPCEPEEEVSEAKDEEPCENECELWGGL